MSLEYLLTLVRGRDNWSACLVIINGRVYSSSLTFQLSSNLGIKLFASAFIGTTWSIRDT